MNREKATAPPAPTLQSRPGSGGRLGFLKTFWFPPPQLKEGGDDGKGNPNYFLLSLRFIVFKAYRGNLSARSVEGQVRNCHSYLF